MCRANVATDDPTHQPTHQPTRMRDPTRRLCMLACGMPFGLTAWHATLCPMAWPPMHMAWPVTLSLIACHATLSLMAWYASLRLL